jgi:hypothetical protein
MATTVVGDTLREVWFNLKSKGIPDDLTNRTAVVRYRIGGGAWISRTGSIRSPETAGVVVMNPEEGNWYAPGIAVGRVLIFDSDGRLGFSRRFSITVEAQ